MHVPASLIHRPLRVVPLLVLAYLFTAPFAERASAQSTAQLQTLLNDTIAQFKLVYRHDVNELHQRYEEVSKAVAAWRAADRTDENNRRLESWLRVAIRHSMPGSREMLPTLPAFENLPASVSPSAPEPERSLLPTDQAGKSPTPPKFRAPTSIVPSTPPQSDVKKLPADAEIAIQNTGVTTTHEETAPGNNAGATPVIEGPTNNELLEANPLPETDKAPETDELPEVDPLPEIEDDPALIEALGDPFLDDAESAN